MPRPERPVNPDAGVVERFAVGLRELRRRAGSPGYRELARRAHYSATTLSQAAGGEKLPSLAVALAYVDACGGSVAEWEVRWHAAAEELNSLERVDPSGEENGQSKPPYLGLAGFEAQDKDLFFGRDRLVSTLVEQIRRQRVVVVVGASGSGKSSLLRAGLIPAVHDHDPASEPQFRTLLMTPGPHPLHDLISRVRAELGQPSDNVANDDADPSEDLTLAIHRVVDRQPAPVEVLLVVDQFEEVFTLCQNTAERDRFITALLAAAQNPTSRVRVVLGLRADFYSHCAEHPRLVETLQNTQLLVAPMTPDELRQAITQPAGRAHCTVETALVARLCADTAAEPGVLPLMSHALLETWRRRRGNTLTLAGYEATGGIHRAVARSAEHAYSTLDPSHQRLAKAVLLRLVAPGEGTEDTKRRVRRTELDSTDPDTAVVLDHLARARLIILDDDAVELAHEALIRHWPRLHDWLAEDRDWLRIHRHLTEATDSWEGLNRDPGALYRGTRLAIAMEWTRGREVDLTPRERHFLESSSVAHDREQAATRRRTRRMRRLIALLAALLLLATAATVYAIGAGHTATQQRNTALAQKALREATSLHASNPALALQLALAAYRLDPTKAAGDTLHELSAIPYATKLTNPAGEVSGLAVSSDGRTLVAASTDKTPRTTLWDISDPHQPRDLPAIPAAASAAQLSPDGRVLALAKDSYSIHLWKLSDPHDPRRFGTITTGIAGLRTAFTAFGPDGHVLATRTADGMAQLWAVHDPDHPQRLATLSGNTYIESGFNESLAFSSDGRLLAAIVSEQDVRLWHVGDPAHPQQSATLTGHTKPVTAVAFSSDGQIVATASMDATIRLWSVTQPEHPQLLATLTGHTDTVMTMAFNPNGRTLATGSADRTTRLWNVTDPRSPRPLAMLTGYTDYVRSVVFTANGHVLAAASGNTVRLEHISQISLASHAAPISMMAISPNNQTMATTSMDNTIRLWDIADRNRPSSLSVIDSVLPISLSFSQDSRTLATTNNDAVTLWDIAHRERPRELNTMPTVDAASTATFGPGNLLGVTKFDRETQLWDVTNPREPRHVAHLNTTATHAMFSSDGQLLAATSSTGSTQLWDIADPQRPKGLGFMTGTAVAFSPHGRTLVTTRTDDGSTRLTDVTNPQDAKELARITTGADINAIPLNGPHATFSPDGRFLVTTGQDQTARVWDITQPRHPSETSTLRGHTADLIAATFTPNGSTIVTAGRDHVIHLWDTTIQQLATRICETAYPRLSNDEWNQYLPGLNYQPPCP